MDPAQNLSRAMPVIFTMAMGPMRLVVVIGDPTIMFDAHLFPRLGFSKVKISHSSLDIDYVELSLPAVVPSPLRPLRWRSRPVSARRGADLQRRPPGAAPAGGAALAPGAPAAHLAGGAADRKSTRLNSSHLVISYAVFCLTKIKPPRSEPEERPLDTTPIVGL